MSGLTRRTVVAAFGCTVASGPLMAKTATLNGTVSYRERIAMPPDAMVSVQLLDVSLADAPAKVLAQTRLQARGQVPVPFRLRYDEARIQPGHRYALRASITVAGKLWFTTTTHHAVFADGATDTNVLVQRVAASAG